MPEDATETTPAPAPADTPTPAPATPATPAPLPTWPPEVVQAFQAFAQRSNEDYQRMAMSLYDQNHAYRQQLRLLRDEESLTLSADEARLWEAYRGLGAVDALTEALAERDNLRAETARLARAQTLLDAASAHGYRHTVLERLIGDETVELREIEQDGETTRAAFVTPADGQDAVRLDEYAAATWPDFIPALAQGANGGSGRNNEKSGMAFIRQQGGGRSTSKPSAAQAYLRKAYQLTDKE